MLCKCDERTACRVRRKLRNCHKSYFRYGSNERVAQIQAVNVLVSRYVRELLQYQILSNGVTRKLQFFLFSSVDLSVCYNHLCFWIIPLGMHLKPVRKYTIILLWLTFGFKQYSVDACGPVPVVVGVAVGVAILLTDNCGPGDRKLHSSCAGR